jgi:hypothetical protein
MRYEELTTPEAVLAAFEAGRRLQFAPGYVYRDQELWRDISSEDVGPAHCIGRDFETGARYRALIEEPAIPEGFTAWGGGECPEDARNRQTEVIFRDGSRETLDGASFRWAHSTPAQGWRDFDIIGFRVETESKDPPDSGQSWDCSNCGQRNSSWADECGRCETPRAGSQPNVDENAPPDVEALAPEIQLALDYSRNFATAKPDIGTTEKVHILGLCDLLERTARRLSPQEPVGLIGTVDRIGEDEHGQPRIVIHVTREAIKALPENLIGKMVTVGRPQVDEAFERIAKSWDDCFYDDDLNGTSIGDRLRSDWLRLATALNPTNPETISHE